jgi:hypothetical protein
MDETSRKMIQDAVDAAGGEQNLADHLYVTPMLLQAYRDGRRPMPESLFLRALDLLHQDPPATQADPLSQEPA